MLFSQTLNRGFGVDLYKISLWRIDHTTDVEDNVPNSHARLASLDEL